MKRRITAALTGALVVCGAALALTTMAQAAPVKTIDGVVLITQADALAGGVTPGDAPGYPITISVAGSYRLGGPLTVTSANVGIEVGAPLVTLDFNGFALDGNGIAPGGVVGFQRSLTVKNGTVRNVTENGIYIETSEAIVSGMRLSAIGSSAIVIVNTVPDTGLEDGRAIVRDNVVTNSFRGIGCSGRGCLIQRNIISDMSDIGILAGASSGGSAIIDSVVSRAQTVGIYLSGSVSGIGRNLLIDNTDGGNPAPFEGNAPGSLGPNVCRPLPNPVPAGC